MKAFIQIINKSTLRTLLAFVSILVSPLFAADTTNSTVDLRYVRTLKAPYVINRLAWHSDGRQIAIAQNLNKKIIIWDTSIGKSIRTIESEAGGVGALAYSPDGKYLAVGRIATRHTPDHAHVHLYYSNTGTLVRKFVPPSAEKGDANDVNALVFSPDGRYLATHGYGGGAVGVVYDISSGAVVAKLEPSTSKFDAVRSLAWSRDGRWIAVGRKGRLELWNATSWKLEKQGDVSRQSIHALAFSPDYRRIAFGGFKVTVEQASTAAKDFSRLPENFRRNRAAPPGSMPNDLFLLDPDSLVISSAFSSHHNGSSIQELIFTPDGKFLISGANARSVAVHEVSSGGEVVFLNDFKQSAHPALSKDGKYVAVGTGQEVQIYEFMR